MPIGGKMSKGFRLLQQIGSVTFEVIPAEEIEDLIKAGKLDRGLVDANIFMGAIDPKASHFLCILRREGVVVGVYHDIIRTGDSEDTLHRDINQWSRSIFAAFCMGLNTVLSADRRDPDYIPRTLDEMIEKLQALRNEDFSSFGEYYNLSPDDQLRQDLRINAPEDRQEELFQRAKALREEREQSKPSKPKPKKTKRVRVR